MKRLTPDQILLLHAHLIEATGGAIGIHDEGLFHSAAEAPYAAIEDMEFYPNVEAKAARLAFGLVSNHPFADGNKRIGILAMLVLLDINGITLTASDKDLIDLGLSLAQGKTDTDGVLAWIHDHVTA